MTKEKDFLGKDITDVIDQACREFNASQEELDIEILETGSAGIFGLCRKQAHIRVKRKPVVQEQASEEPAAEDAKPKEKAAGRKAAAPPAEEEKSQESEVTAEAVEEPSAAGEKRQPVEKEKPRKVPEGKKESRKETVVEPPSQDVLDSVKGTVSELLEQMGFPSTLELTVKGNTINCLITGEFEEDITGADGRTLDSLQYLLRKMLLEALSDKYLLALNAGDFRERRAEELKQRATELAAQVKEDGKTQAIPALNPSERRIVHMVLQDDKAVRSRSVGEGLFKKVLIYKPGKGRRSGGRKKRG